MLKEFGFTYVFCIYYYVYNYIIIEYYKIISVENESRCYK